MPKERKSAFCVRTIALHPSCTVAQAVSCAVQVSLLQQAEDRAHRKGQTHDCVNVYFLCAKGTCDDRR